MRQHPATGPGISPHLAHLSGGCEVAAVRVPGRVLGRVVWPWFGGRLYRDNVGGVRALAGRSAAEFPTLDFRGT